MSAIKNYNGNRDVISLFSGAMGLDLGLKGAGLNLTVSQDIDQDCLTTMKENGHNPIPGDIREISPSDVLKSAGLNQGEPFLVCGGPPCQPFSTAGKRLGITDPRGSLFMDFIRMLDHIRPRFFIMENVRGLMSSSVKGNQSGPMVLNLILNEFKKLGYKTVYGLLDAVNYGVPQFRERFFLLGSRDDEDIFLPLPTHFPTHQNIQSRWVTLRQAIGGLEDDPGELLNFSPDRKELLQMVPPGGNWRNLPPELIEKAMGGAYRSRGGKVGFFRRLSYEEPCPTLVTSPMQKASMLCHPTKDRPLSIKEYALIQQFPQDWVFYGSIASRYRQIGNAVPIGLATALGEALIAVAEGKATIQTKRGRGTNVHTRIRNALETGGSRGFSANVQ